ncbi:MAG: hypothetical protein ACE5D7_05020, partial [Fidelibacterota bacterium]
MYNQANNNVSDPSYWEKKYQSGNTHWDLNGPTPAILEWIKKIDGIKKICIIGAGNGYDAIEIAKLGHDV